LDLPNEKHQRSLARWRKIIAQCQASNLHVSEFCRQNNLSKHAYYYWHKRVGETISKNADANVSKPCFVPVPVSEEEQRGTEFLTLHLGQTSLDVYERTPDNLLVKALLAVKKVQQLC